MHRIAGYVDRVTDRAVLGWIANLDQPRIMELIVCHGSNDITRDFRSFFYRQDVSRALELDGKFGFAVPFSALRDLGQIISFRDRNGVLLTHGDAICLPEPGDPEDDLNKTVTDVQPIYIVLHIQKTAGTSLRSAVAEDASEAEIVFLYPDGVSGLRQDELNSLPLHQRRRFRFAMGHTYFGISKYFPRRPEYITILRDPLARIRSHFNHHVTNESQFKIDGAIISVDEVVGHGLTEEFDNLMTRMVAGTATDVVPIGEIGEKDVELALYNIRTAFRFIGLTERLNTEFSILCKILGIQDRKLKTINAAEPKYLKAMSQGIDWAAVMHRNRFDQLLYERVQVEGLCGRDLKDV